MIIHISIQYQSKWGEAIYICFENENSIQDKLKNEVELQYRNQEEWGIALDINNPEIQAKGTYFYRIRKNGIMVKEDKCLRTLPSFNALLSHQSDAVYIHDEWNQWSIPHEIYKRDVFSQTATANTTKPQTVASKTLNSHYFCVTTHILSAGKKIGILGNVSELNHWDVKNPIMLEQYGNQWRININFAESDTIQYKYVICDENTGELIAFEKGNNRMFFSDVNTQNHTIWNQFADFSAYAWKAAGLNVPLGSLRSESDWGIGDFSTLGECLEWVHLCGIKLVQLLPINDTMTLGGTRDSYPYSSISAFAIHPIYLDVNAVAQKYDFPINNEVLIEAKRLNQLPTLDYVAVVELKLTLLKEIYKIIFFKNQEDGHQEQFLNAHKDWLLPYAAFSVLRDDFRTADTAQWHSYRTYRREEIEAIWNSEGRMKTEMAFYIFLQYELHEQCKEVRNKAKGYKIVLKGDLPIGVGRNSVETWTRPVLFHMDEQAGAPPDAFTKKGQNWFFPTYNWDEMEKDNYQWWTSRMVLLGQYFDAIRIDHILGFFRIWSIPISAKEGLLGRFVPAKGFSRFEIENWGLGTHLNKLCNPFYTDKLMQTKFGEKWIEIKSVFFDANGFNNEFETQQALIDFVSSHPEWEEFLDGLLELKTDLVFLQDPKDVETFHFRINMMDTDSFKSLSWNDQMLLKEKYYDYFFRNQNEDWKLRGAQKLEHIKHASSMMICAEDLGMVPDFVEGVLQEKEMLTLQVQRMPKKMGVAFSNPADASYLSVVTPSTHDMSPLRMWWEEDRSMTQKFYQEVMHAVGKEPELCSEEVVRWIVNDHLHSPAMWSIFLIQDMISISKKYWNPDLSLDRINNPANPYHYWNYRMQINIETLIKDSAYNNMIKDMIVESGRAN